MSTAYNSNKPRPFSAGVTSFLKFRPQSSNCPTIVKHEITSPSEALLLNTTPSEKRFDFDRPLTANTTTRLKLSTLQNFRPGTANNSARPFSSTFGNTTVNFQFLNEFAKTSSSNGGKFKDHSGLKPKRKLKTDQFHNAIYKVKQQKEMLEKEISRVEDLQRTMKETNLWNTPQTAIVESILKKNAQQDPNGTISKFLRTEREAKLKQSSLRTSKRATDRPQSAFLRNSLRSAKTVEDFFSNDDDYDHETIEEILTSGPRQDYNVHKKKITHKINQFLDNAPTYHSIVQTTKENSSMGQLSSPKFPLKLPTSPSYDLFQTLTQGDEPHQPFISEIIESPEITETTPKHNEDTSYNPPKAWIPMKSRPFSAKMALKPHLYSPKEFDQRAKTPWNALQGKPMAIHTRPSTAKNARFSTASNLSINGDQRPTSMTGVRFVPLVMEGQKITSETYNLSRYNNNLTMSTTSKAASIRNLNTEEQTIESNMEEKGSKSVKSLKAALAQAPFRPVKSGDYEGGMYRNAVKSSQRPTTASSKKGKMTLGTQTVNPELPSIGRVDINSQYFEAFSSEKNN